MRTFIEIADDLNDLVTELNDKIVESIWAKTADVAPVRHGRWVQRKIRESQFVQNGYTRLYCSVCGEYSEVESNYCPNCGAKMDEENGDED